MGNRLLKKQAVLTVYDPAPNTPVNKSVPRWSKMSYESTDDSSEAFFTSPTSHQVTRLRGSSFGLIDKNPSRSGITLRQILTHPGMSERLFQLAYETHCDEQLLFIQDINSQILNPEYEEWEFIEQMWIKYIDQENSPKTLNINSNLNKRLHQAYEFHGSECMELLIEVAHECFEDLKRSQLVMNFIKRDAEATRFHENVDIITVQTYLMTVSFYDIKKRFDGDEQLLNQCRLVLAIRSALPLTGDEKSSKMRVIYVRYLSDGAMYRVEGFPVEYNKVFQDGRVNQLSDAYVDGVYLITQNAHFMQYVRGRVNSL